jgi:Protein of unknown function (DUF1822)
MPNYLVRETMNNIDNDLLTFTVSLPQSVHAIARDLVTGIDSPIKANQIRLNTLAVYAVDNYLRCLGFTTDWNHSDSRDPILAQLLNIANLEVKDVGQIECIPFISDRSECHIPPESEYLRVGYMPVQINQSLTEATILGFSTQKKGAIQLNKLADLEYAIEYLTNLEQPAIIRLSEWLKGLVDPTWETVNHLLNPQQQRLICRDTVNRGQTIAFPTTEGVTSLALVLDIKSTEVLQKVDVLIQIYPIEQNELPDGVKLMVSDNEETMMTAISKPEDNWIQLNFTAVLNEEFKVAVKLGELEVVKSFIV